MSKREDLEFFRNIYIYIYISRSCKVWEAFLQQGSPLKRITILLRTQILRFAQDCKQFSLEAAEGAGNTAVSQQCPAVRTGFIRAAKHPAWEYFRPHTSCQHEQVQSEGLFLQSYLSGGMPSGHGIPLGR